MDQNFILPSGLLGRFAIVKLWPELKTAEDECIARLKIAASMIGIECIEIHADGRLLENPGKIVGKKDVDFVLHLHYDTPKLYDVFSLVALWNPVQFYHVWGFARTSRNLLTHDDFVSCSSLPADHHVGRLIRRSANHLPPFFNLYHSTADIVNVPSLGDQKLFYAGINWDALRGGVSRHQELLKLLDISGNLRIFGPSVFQGVKVWAGYASYVREIPFDGVSMIDEISRAGIALVLSSQAHKDSELMSNRLFESVAAGALVICDENNFAKKFFGESLLYVDSRCSVEQMCADIGNHLAWAKANPARALAMITESQDIFRKKFALKNNLGDIYNALPERQLRLLERQASTRGAQIDVTLCLLLPEYSEDVLNVHFASATAQEYSNFTTVLIVDRLEAGKNRSAINNLLEKLSINVILLEIDFFTSGIHREVRVKRRIGAVITDVLERGLHTEAVVFVAPNEKIFSNHLQVLAGSLARNPESNCATSAVIHLHAGQPVNSVSDRIDFRQLDARNPIGYARFIFRVSSLPTDLSLALPYVDRKSMAILIGDNAISSELPSTVLLYVDHEFPSGLWDEGQENELISSYCPKAFEVFTGNEIVLPTLSAGIPSLVMAAAVAADNVWRITKLLSLPWLVAQVRLVRQQSFAARLKVLCRKLKSGSA